jgi:hypothetical protein
MLLYAPGSVLSKPSRKFLEHTVQMGGIVGNSLTPLHVLHLSAQFAKGGEFSVTI